MADTAVPNTEFLRVSDAARRANVSDDAVRHWYDSGEVTGVRSVHGHRLIDPVSLQHRLNSIGVSEAARLYGKPEGVIRGWFDRGLIAGYLTPGGLRRIERNSLAERIDAERAERQ